jgi:hypothetical protein
VLACFYGILVDNNQLIVVNLVGLLLEALYLIFYLFYTPYKVNAKETANMLKSLTNIKIYNIEKNDSSAYFRFYF